MPNLNQFYRQFTLDLARANRFEVTINPPSISSISQIGGIQNANAVLTYRCETAQLPGRHLTTAQQKTFGPYEKFPVHTTYNDIDLTFIMDGNMEVRKFFDGWLETINPSDSFNMEYKGNYVTDMVITQYDLQDNPVYAVGLIDAFPININQQDLNWGSDAIHKLTVTFAYTYWEDVTQTGSVPQPPTQAQINEYINGVITGNES